MFVEIYKDLKAYRGDIEYRENDYLSLKDIESDEVFNVCLTGEYILVEHDDDSIKNRILRDIQIVKDDELLSDDDKDFIISKEDILEHYKIIKTLRILSLPHNNLLDVDLIEFKKGLMRLIEEEYIYNVTSINDDEDLTEQEKNMLIMTLDRAKTLYLDKVNTLTCIKLLLKEFPPMFNDKLIYIGEVINYLEYIMNPIKNES